MVVTSIGTGVCASFSPHALLPRPNVGRSQVGFPQSGGQRALIPETTKKRLGGIFAKKLRPVVERFRMQHEKNVSEERLKALGVSRWSKWECGPFVTTYWKWEADELVYITKGSLEFTPWGCEDSAFFYAGDLVLFRKWMEGNLSFDEDYQQYYKFFAYGD